MGLKWPKREANHSLPYTVKRKKSMELNFPPPYVFSESFDLRFPTLLECNCSIFIIFSFHALISIRYVIILCIFKPEHLKDTTSLLNLFPFYVYGCQTLSRELRIMVPFCHQHLLRPYRLSPAGRGYGCLWIDEAV